MDLQYTEEQLMLRNTVADFVSRESPISRARKLHEDETGWEAAVWKQMGELGWLAFPFAESLGGFGGQFVDAAIIVEELGKALVPEPFVASIVTAGQALALAGNEQQQQNWLAPVLAGEATLAFAASEADNRYHIAERAGTTLDANGNGYILTGEKVWVDNGQAADTLLVTASGPDGLTLVAVEADRDGVERRTVKTIDGRRAAIIRFNGTPISADHIVGNPGDDTVALVDRVRDLGAAAACAEAVGVSQVAFDMTVEYLKTRVQFDVPIGAFQALQHRAVDMFIENELLRAATLAAALRVDEDDVSERHMAVSAAKKQLAVGGKFVAYQAIQLHGGIGITEEHDIGLYLKRMQALGVLFGDEAWHEARYADEPAFQAR
ncbi:MAG: pimeloyl-CoA dehydrogenase small subunit [Candidatus Dadabacteria bacterium]|nr:MAG: pimeloyl-CoA dehydrogenase small subunit [Candidatus Dadabacteria bacterium]